MAEYRDKLRRQDYNIPRRMGYEPRKKKIQRRITHSEQKLTKKRQKGKSNAELKSRKIWETDAEDGMKSAEGIIAHQEIDDISEFQFSRKRRTVSSPAKRRAARLKLTAPAEAVSAKLHHEVNQRSDENTGVEAANTGNALAERGAGLTAESVGNHHYAAKLKNSVTAGSSGDDISSAATDRGLRFTESRTGAEHTMAGDAAGSSREHLYGTEKKSRGGYTETSSNLLSRLRQRQDIRHKYAEAARKASRGEAAAGAAEGIRSLRERLSDAFLNVTEGAKEHPMLLLLAGFAAIILMMTVGGASSASLLISGSGNGVISTSFTAEDDDILGCEEDYVNLEKKLQEEIRSVESENPDFDEYRYQLDTIGHNPYELASVMTILFEDYRRNDDAVQKMLQTLFDAQYELIFDPVTEIRTREVERIGEREVYNPVTGQTETEEYTYTETEEYEYRILNVTMINHQLLQVIHDLDLSEDEMERFQIILSLKGNRAYLFGDDIYSNIDADADGTPQNPYLDYRVPGEALTDQEFARMYQEAEKYLGRTYVWGGSTPEQGFDCSGYVCWVINASGVGHIGRTTAEGIRQWTDPIPASERKPGDIVYFQGTYNTPGASHVGIYVGGGMMIHCGNPCKFSNIDSGYFANHMLGYGRIPED